MKKTISFFVVMLFLMLSGLPFSAFAQETDIVSLVSGGDHTVALRADGTVWTWGRNANGQLGDGSFSNRNIPTRVAMLRDIIFVAAGDAFSLAVRADGTVWGWGWNGNSQLGDGTTGNQPTPVQAKDPSDASGFLTGVIAVAAGERHSLALKADGSVWSVGYNANGQLGNGTYDGSQIPVRVKDPLDTSGFLTGVKAIAAGSLHSIALKNDKTVRTWGSQGYMQLGRASHTGYTPQHVAGQVAGMTNVKAVAGGWEHTVVLKEDGTVWTAGRNLEGQLGDGTTVGSFWPNPPSPPKLFVQVINPTDEPDPSGYLTGIAAISADNRYAVAVKQNGSVYGWGSNYGEKFCDTATGNKLTPTKIKDPADPTTFVSGVSAVSAGGVFNLMLKENGTIWGCGYNYWGQLGDGTWLSPRATPENTQFPPASLIRVYAFGYIAPGEEGTFLVEYENVTGVTLQNSVAVLTVPTAVDYLSNTGGGVHWAEKGQVFWKLGDLLPGASGRLTVKVSVPWGLPLHTKDKVSAGLGAQNIPSPFDVNEYLTYGSVDLVTEKMLDSAEIATLLSQNVALADLLQSVKNQGFSFLDVAAQMKFSNGSSLSRLVLLNVEKLVPVFIHLMNGRVSAEKIDGTRYSLFDLHGGLTFDTNDGTLVTWGTWSEAHSLSFSQCLFNCFVENIPMTLLKKYIMGVDMFMKFKDCVECERTGDEVKCAACCNTVTGLGGADFKKHLKQFVCLDDCSDPSTRDKHICTKPKKECSPSGFWRSASMWLFEEDVVYATACNTSLGGIYGATVAIQCAIGEVCNPAKAGGPDCDNPENLNKPPTGDEKDFEYRTGQDPNAKSADIKGDALPGQTITYTVEYENVGTGPAYGVFILDRLDPNLDESTLSFVSPAGTYISSGRLVSWDIGTVPAGGKGSRSFSIRVRDGLANGTLIVNRADVYFPSSNEITPTNPVVHVVQSLVAVPQTVAATAGLAAPINLTGRTFGSGSLNYRVVSGPFYGTLSGVAPVFNYTSTIDFSGQDEFSFVVNDGLTDSLPATVKINVQANPADKNPPTVIRVTPEANAIDVRPDAAPVEVSPARYSPTLIATFTEPLDAATVTTATFTVQSVSGSVSGAVSYDEKTWSALFMPLAPLSSGKTYTARVKTGVKDKSGNLLASELVWSFSTGTPANAVVTLPDGGGTLRFEETQVGKISPDKLVTVSSAGTENLIITSLGVTGTNPGDFTIVEDQCSGRTLLQNQSCTVRIGFHPSSVGPRNAVLSISANDPDPPPGAILSGNGTVPPLTGDCDNNGTVTIAEVQSAINMFLGLNEVQACVDADFSSTVSIAEVQKVINGFLGL